MPNRRGEFSYLLLTLFLISIAWAEISFGDTAPVIQSVTVNGQTRWVAGQIAPLALAVGDEVTVNGSGFGAGPDGDYAKILLGTTRVLERDLSMFHGTVNLLQQLFYETPKIFDFWAKDLAAWSDTQIQFRVPVTASRGPLVVYVQKRVGTVPELLDPSLPHIVLDPLSERVRGKISRTPGLVSRLGGIVESEQVPVTIDNPGFAQRVQDGEAIYWAYDFNMGQVHLLRGMDWNGLLSGQRTDPVTGLTADPTRLFGAIPAKEGEVPAVALATHAFNPYPAPMPIKPLFRRPLLAGKTTPTGFVGYVAAQSIHPVTQLKGSWVGFNCASCHAQRVTYEDASGQTVSRVFPGLPNTDWSMKWNVLGGMNTVQGYEPGPDGTMDYVDKTLVIYALPNGVGEHSLVRHPNDGSPYGNDNLFSPIAIPIITRHTPVRRALSHTELIAGFEGSYVHAEEPDGAIGALHADALQSLTAYMSTLDANDDVLKRVGVYRWLSANGLGAEVGGAREGGVVKNGLDAYPVLQARLQRGQQIFRRDCFSCHQVNFGTWSNEDMFPFTEVGTYFSPTIYHKKNQSIRTAILRDLYWVQGRGLLHDGHVKSLEDLVHPDRCREGTALYNHYYQLGPQTFHIPKGTAAQEKALRHQAYFVDVPWDTTSLYWDYQTMRKSFGPRELGASSPVTLPAAPHPWCTQSAGDVADLVAFLLTL